MPLAALPPGTPFTLQVTAVFVVLLTEALKLCVLPKSTMPLFGETMTAICGGGGGGPPEPLLCEHPEMLATTTSAASSQTASVAPCCSGNAAAALAVLVCVRGRILA